MINNKQIFVLGWILLGSLQGKIYAQTPIQSLETTPFLDKTLDSTWGRVKTLPLGFERQALLALSYFPELKNTHIEFEVKVDPSPLVTMPSFWSIFLHPKNRTYIITISTQSDSLFQSILLKNLPFEAQVGVLGHELSHVSDFQHYSFFDFVVHAIKYTMNVAYGDTFEYQTDRICINHGLGYQLLAWSKVCQSLDVEKVKKKFGITELTERYMYPSTIQKIIDSHPLYR